VCRTLSQPFHRQQGTASRFDRRERTLGPQLVGPTETQPSLHAATFSASSRRLFPTTSALCVSLATLVQRLATPLARPALSVSTRRVRAKLVFSAELAPFPALLVLPHAMLALLEHFRMKPGSRFATIARAPTLANSPDLIVATWKIATALSMARAVDDADLTRSPLPTAILAQRASRASTTISLRLASRCQQTCA